MNLGVTNDFLCPSNGKIMKKNLDVTKPCSEQILPVPWPFMKWRFHCIIFSCFKLKQETKKIFFHVIQLQEGGN